MKEVLSIVNDMSKFVHTGIVHSVQFRLDIEIGRVSSGLGLSKLTRLDMSMGCEAWARAGGLIWLRQLKWRIRGAK